jgi:hypothetical protein
VLRIQCLTVDCHDPLVVARFWAAALGWEVTDTEDDFAVVEPGERSQRDVIPDLLFLKVDDDKGVKNRLHLDLRPDDQSAEVARLEALGAVRVDVGQAGDPEATWVVLADPEGNEFCVLRARST